jgi:hypothetical protein
MDPLNPAISEKNTPCSDRGEIDNNVLIGFITNLTVNGDMNATTKISISVAPIAAQYFSRVMYFGKMKYIRV